MDNINLYWALVSASGMVLVAIVAVAGWRLLTGVQYRWFWVGAALWTVAVAIKLITAYCANAAVFGFLKDQLPHWAFPGIGGLYGGLQSSLCEIGLTWLAVLVWRQLGQDADRAIGIGFGAGAFEAALIGLASASAVLAAIAGVEGTGPIRDGIQSVATMPLFWLVGPVERVIAILCHASTRALVILGSVHRRPWMIIWGFFIFTYIDGVATVARLSGMLGEYSTWWVELAIVPAAVVSIPILRQCYSQWGRSREVAMQESGP